MNALWFEPIPDELDPVSLKSRTSDCSLSIKNSFPGIPPPEF